MSAKNICGSLTGLLGVIERLTAHDGCPWDRQQTAASLADYVIEESYELVAAIRAGDPKEVCEELGDVAFLLLFIALTYERKGDFSFADALDSSAAKMIRRHPHVFAGAEFASLEEQLKAWEAIKREERAPRGLYDSLPPCLPPLIKAYRIHSKAARVGFTWPDDEEVERQVESEWLEWLDAAQNGDAEAKNCELGDMLFSLVELGRRHGIKASESLDLANARFLKRFRRMEELARQKGRDFPEMTLDEKDELWNEAKKEEEAAKTGTG